MKARPILFSSPMVRALLAGTKTQTRRAVKPQPPTPEAFRGSDFGLDRAVADGVKMYSQNDYDRLPKHPTDWELLGSVGVARIAGFPKRYPCPYGQPGDLLIVRETHWRWGHWRKDGLTTAGRQRWRFVALDKHPVAYCLPDDKRLAATCYPGMDRETVGYWKRPSLFMPRSASRLTLEITDVRVERLQAISEADAEAEGLFRWDEEGPGGASLPAWGWEPREAGYGFVNAPAAYRALWTHINGPGSWDANPYVWAVSFAVHRANVDAVLAERAA